MTTTTTTTKTTTVMEIVAVALVRIVGASFAIAAILSVPSTRDMLNNDYEVTSDGVLLVPIQICIPTEIIVSEGESITIPVTEENDEGCHDLSYFINVCVMSLILSVVATGFYFGFDLAARFKFGNITRSAVASLSLFFVFILLQTVVCCWAIAEELNFWNGYFDDIHSKLQDSSLYESISDIETRGNRMKLMVTGLLGLLFVILLLVESFITLCCCGSRSSSKEQQPSMTEPMKTAIPLSSPSSNNTFDLDESKDSTGRGSINSQMEAGGTSNSSIAFGTTSELPPWADANSGY